MPERIANFVKEILQTGPGMRVEAAIPDAPTRGVGDIPFLAKFKAHAEASSAQQAAQRQLDDILRRQVPGQRSIEPDGTNVSGTEMMFSVATGWFPRLPLAQTFSALGCCGGYI